MNFPGLNEERHTAFIFLDKAAEGQHALDWGGGGGVLEHSQSGYNS